MNNNPRNLAKWPIWAIVRCGDGKNPARIRKMVKRLKTAENVNVKQTEFAGAVHCAARKAAFSTTELVNWYFGLNL